jgi:signal peptidase I
MSAAVALRRLDRLGTLLLAVALAALAAAATTTFAGRSLLVERSDSMRPALRAGDLLVTDRVPAEAIGVGDIVTFADTARANRLVTHRVVAIRRRDAATVFTTRGDANSATESFAVGRGDSVRRVSGRARGVGRLAIALRRITAATMPAFTWSAWTGTTGSGAGTLSAVADWLAPAVDAAAVGKAAGGSTGAIHQGGDYRIYANVSDAGNPASGTSTVTANAGSISTGLTTVALSAGSFSAQNVSYNRRSALLTANAALSEGSYATTIATADAAANSAVVSGPSVTVDNVAPTGSLVQIDNGSLVVGHPDSGDVVTFGWSETLDPSSMLAGWSGSATAVQVFIADVGASDVVSIRSSGGIALPAGTITTNSQYATTDTTFTATMVQSGASIVVTLGTLVTGTVNTNAKKAALSWSAGDFPGATDAAGNALIGSTITEPGPSDVDF